MMDTGLYITQSLAVNWLPWLSLGMLGLVWLSCMMQPKYLHGLVVNGLAGFSDNVGDQYPSIGSQITQWLFNSITPAMGLFVMSEMEAIEGGALFARILGLSLLADFVRVVVALLVQYTFRLGRLMGVAYLRYFSLRSLFSFILFAMLMLAITTSPQDIWLVLLGVLSAIYLLLLGWQWGQLFATSPAGVIGLTLYLLTVELLPAVLLWQAGIQLFFLHIV